jgi:hypothetical protein
MSDRDVRSHLSPIRAPVVAWSRVYTKWSLQCQSLAHWRAGGVSRCCSS